MGVRLGLWCLGSAGHACASTDAPVSGARGRPASRARHQGSRRAPCGLLESPRGACGGLVTPAPARCARGLWGLSGLEQVSLRASRSGAGGPARSSPGRLPAGSAPRPQRRGERPPPAAGGRCHAVRGPHATAPGGGGRGRRRRRGQWPRMPDDIGGRSRPPAVALLHRGAARRLGPVRAADDEGVAEGGRAQVARACRTRQGRGTMALLASFFPCQSYRERTRRFSGVV